MFSRSWFVLLSFFFWPLYCLSFYDLRLLITSLVSSNFPYIIHLFPSISLSLSYCILFFFLLPLFTALIILDYFMIIYIVLLTSLLLLFSSFYFLIKIIVVEDPFQGGGLPLTSRIPPHVCAYPKPGHGFQTPCVVVVCVVIFLGEWWLFVLLTLVELLTITV